MQLFVRTLRNERNGHNIILTKVKRYPKLNGGLSHNSAAFTESLTFSTLWYGLCKYVLKLLESLHLYVYRSLFCASFLCKWNDNTLQWMLFLRSLRLLDALFLPLTFSYVLALQNEQFTKDDIRQTQVPFLNEESLNIFKGHLFYANEVGKVYPRLCSMRSHLTITIYYNTSAHMTCIDILNAFLLKVSTVRVRSCEQQLIINKYIAQLLCKVTQTFWFGNVFPKQIILFNWFSLQCVLVCTIICVLKILFIKLCKKVNNMAF